MRPIFPDLARYRTERIALWNDYTRKPLLHYYHAGVRRLYRLVVPPGARVLEIGCSGADLLASLKPAFGVGLDFSPVAIAVAKRNYPELHVAMADAHNLCLTAKFDYITDRIFATGGTRWTGHSRHY